MKPHITTLLAIALAGAAVHAQDNRAVDRALREGNAAYRKDSVAQAAAAYEQAAGDPRGSFNLGNALYKQQQYDKAKERFDAAAKATTDPKAQARAYHNLGNSMLELKKPEEAVKAFKEALKRNPADEDTRYNLAYAQRMLQQQQKNDQNKDDQKKDDQNKDQNNKDKDQQQKDQEKKDQQEKQDQEKKDQEQQQQDQQQDQSQAQQQPHPGQIDKRDAQRILDQLNREEKNIQQRIMEQRRAATRIPIEMDW